MLPYYLKYMLKIMKLLLPIIFSSFLYLHLNALDLSKIDSGDFIGGNPYSSGKRVNSVQKTSSNSPQAKPLEGSYRGSAQERKLDTQIRKYQSNQKGLLGIYRGKAQERQIDKQIQQYRPYAKKNAEAFGEDAKSDPNFNRHVNLHEIQKVTPGWQSRDRVPEYRTKAGVKPPQAPLNPYFSKPPKR
jgi:hypothetical protein